jgi:ethanolamine utilization protein EutA
MVLDVNRLRWRVIEIVSDYLRTNFGKTASDLDAKFASTYGIDLETSEAARASEVSRLHLLIRGFKPALSEILGPSVHFDRLVQIVSPLLNEALSTVEQESIQSSLKEHESARRLSAPKSRIIQLYDSRERMNLLSVGIDIGSSTSHLIFSRLDLSRERSFQNPTNRYTVVHREILYESDIIFTPLLDRSTIDIEAIAKFCQEEYRKAGFTPDMVDTGAVIVTGESAKKQNAEEIVRRLSSESGKFVSAVAGPNYESLLGALGSGALDLSERTGRTILHTDIGGGTSNLALCSNGLVQSTSCINIGGRLLGIDKSFRIWRIDEPTRFVMQELGIHYEVGDVIPEVEARRIARAYAEALVEVLQGPAKSNIARELLMTENLDFSIPVDDYSFSGGVAELFYGDKLFYDDIGVFLAEELRTLLEAEGLLITEPDTKIRATVIGAGAFTLSVSGSTCYFDEAIEFPLTSIPVLPINVTTANYHPGRVEAEISKAMSKHDLVEGTDVVALYFEDPLYRSYSWLQDFVKEIEHALPRTIANGKVVVLLFRSDIGKMVGLMAKRETAIQQNLISLDELSLKEGDWIDIGKPLQDTQVFPVTVKSLVFNEAKEYN